MGTQQPGDHISKKHKQQESSTPFLSDEEVRRRPSPKRTPTPVPHSTLSGGRMKGIGLFSVCCCSVLIIVCMLMVGRWFRLKSAELINPVRSRGT